MLQEWIGELMRTKGTDLFRYAGRSRPVGIRLTSEVCFIRIAFRTGMLDEE